MSKINFEAKLLEIGTWNIIKLPKNVSTKLPSRGLVMVNGTINNFAFQEALEPDGEGSHWFKVSKSMQEKGEIKPGKLVKLSIEPTKEWPEPDIPADLKKALNASIQASTTWNDITPMARWDWIRWIRSTKNPETRKIRIEKTFSKFKDGIRRPCCFNRTECSIPDVSNKGILLIPVNA